MFENAEIQKNSPIPMYFQLKQIMMGAIKKGELKPEECIPTETELTKRFDLSRTTVRQALLELTQEGYLFRIKGKGTFVEKPKINQDFMFKVESYADQMLRLGLKPKTKVLEFKKQLAGETEADNLDINVNDEVIKLSRLRYVGNTPVVIVTTYLRGCYDFLFDHNLSQESLYDIMKRSQDSRVVLCKRRFTAILASDSESKFLKIEKGSAIQLVYTIGFNEKNIPVEYSMAKYVGALNEFTVYAKVD